MTCFQWGINTWKRVIIKKIINFNTDTQGGRIKLVQMSMKSDLSQLLSTGGFKSDII